MKFTQTTDPVNPRIFFGGGFVTFVAPINCTQILDVMLTKDHRPEHTPVILQLYRHMVSTAKCALF